MTFSSSHLLQQYFGFTGFKPGQQQVIDSVLAGQSAAAIFPTGSGKSLCYQLPAIALPHLTLVISPLLALMQDQLQFLNDKGIAAASIDSMQTKEQSTQVMSGVRTGHIKILMISVERLNNERFRQFLSQITISLLVVDEAHCISEWGHNFRPDYLKLPSYARLFNIPQVLLLTATATDKVIVDMRDKFNIENKNVTLTGFYRENLSLHVVGVALDEKLAYVQNWLKDKSHSPGIIYVTLQQSAELLANQLKQQGIPATPYHAGMNSEDRQRIQAQFMSGEIPVIVATIAFGMGIDKSNIRYVVHYDLPKSIENYAQEIGRAGRDGKPSQCLVLANYDNLNVLENFIFGDTPESTAIDYVINEICNFASDNNNHWEVVLNSLSSQSNIRILSLKTLLVYLELAGLITPAFSYFAEYKFKLNCSEQQLIDKFSGERHTFVQALLQSSDKARIWFSINFDRLQALYPSDRTRVIAAIEYFDEQGFIELQAKQITDVYKINATNINIEELRIAMFKRFSQKEKSEINRIDHLLKFFASKLCLSQQLAQYFSDNQLQQPCGHCSVCLGHEAIIPQAPMVADINQQSYQQLATDIHQKLGEMASAPLIARFLCGLTTPIFTKLRVRKLSSFAALENYRYAEVLHWVERNFSRN